MAKSQAVTESELQTIIDQEISGAMSLTELQAKRVLAMQYYQGEPFGNEVEGRSSVVSTDVSDTVEWIMPTLMRIFMGGDRVVEYEPQTQRDEEGAKQATEYADYIFTRDNPGFLILYSNFKDALLQKNGIGKVYWDDTPTEKRERYYGLDDQAYTALVNADDVTVSEHTETKQGEIPYHDVVVTRKGPSGKNCVYAVPPEHFIISRDAWSIEDARLVGDRKRTSLSELREEGYSESVLTKVGAGPDVQESSVEDIARDTVENLQQSPTDATPATEPIWRTECYVKADVDGDGIAEMRQVTVAGVGNVIIKNEPWDEERPYYSVTPIIMPHRFWGRSVAELVTDLQLIRSTILRQYLDNLYLQNNQREEVVENNIIDPSEVLTSRPGTKIRVKAVDSVRPIVVPPIGQAALEGLAYFDTVQERRTGVSDKTQGLGANPLHDTKAGEIMLMSAAMSKIELIARVFAETGVKRLFKLILRNIVKYQQESRVIRLRDKWVSMDPRSWNEDMDVTISVGIGTGDNQQKMQNAVLLGQAQSAAAQSGVLQVTPQNAFATFELLVSAMGLKGPERFITIPPPGTPPPPNPAMAKIQADAQLGQQKMQSEAALTQAKTQAQAALQQQKMQMDAQAQAQKAQYQAQVDHLHNVMEAQREHAKAQNEMMISQVQMKLDAQLQVLLAHIKAATSIEVARITAKQDDGAAAYAKESAQE